MKKPIKKPSNKRKKAKDKIVVFDVVSGISVDRKAKKPYILSIDISAKKYDNLEDIRPWIIEYLNILPQFIKTMIKESKNSK